jgi:hypothetical protein
MDLFIGSALISCLNSWYKNYPDNSNSCITLDELPTDKPIVVFGAGAGYWAYYLGISKFIQETYPIDDCNFVGISAGTISCLGLVNKTSIDIVFAVCIEHLRILNEHTSGLFGRWCLNCRHLSIQCMHDNKCVISHNRRLFCAFSQITRNGLQKRYFNCGQTYDDIVDAATTSYWIPFVTAPFSQPVRKINGMWCIDGYMSGRDKAKDALFIYPTIFERLPLSTYWLWLGREYNIGLYKMGYDHAKKYRQKLDAFFVKKSDVPTTYIRSK